MSTGILLRIPLQHVERGESLASNAGHLEARHFLDVQVGQPAYPGVEGDRHPAPVGLTGEVSEHLTTERSCFTVASVGGEVVGEHPPVVVRMDKLAAVGVEVPDHPAAVPFPASDHKLLKEQHEHHEHAQTDRSGDRRHRDRLGRTSHAGDEPEARARLTTMTPVTAMMTRFAGALRRLSHANRRKVR